MPHTMNQHGNSIRRNLLTIVGQHTGRNNDKILHWPTNSTETARRYHTNLEINLYTACHVLRDESMRKFTRKKFTDNVWTDDLLDETTTYCTNWQIQHNQLVDTTPTQKLIYTLLAMPYMMNRYRNSTERNYWRCSDDLLDETMTKFRTDQWT